MSIITTLLRLERGCSNPPTVGGQETVGVFVQPCHLHRRQIHLLLPAATDAPAGRVEACRPRCREDDSKEITVGTLLFLKTKRASASRSDIKQVESEAFTAACAYYIETGLRHIWT